MLYFNHGTFFQILMSVPTILVMTAPLVVTLMALSPALVFQDLVEMAHIV
jgi:hypothetical protein